MTPKTASIKTKLQPHQQDAVDKALRNNLILAHSTGSGKTLTSIAIADALGKPTTVLTPASLVENFKKELSKHKKGGPTVQVMSLPTAVSKNYQIPQGNTVIIDEAHSIRNAGTARQNYVKDQIRNAGRVIALTGTPQYNDVSDIAPLVNIVANDKVLPEGALFNDKYIDVRTEKPSWIDRAIHGATPSEHKRLKNKKELEQVLSQYFHVFDTDVNKPDKREETIEVPMDDDQLSVYRYLENDIPASLRWKVKNNLPPSRSEASRLSAFYGGVRQAANTPETFQSNDKTTGAKILKATDILVKAIKDNPKLRALVYSNYLDSGINSYAKVLDRHGIKYNIFDGSLTPKRKKEIVDAYNSGEVPIILGSGSASEGLDLKNTRLIQLLEPYWNNSKLDQVIGRGIRYKSHEDLPPEDRNVKVQRFVSTLPVIKKLIGEDHPTSIDQYLYSRAAEKEKLMREVKNLMHPYTQSKEASFTPMESDLYSKIKSTYPQYKIVVNPEHTSSGTAIMRGDDPHIILRDEDPLVLAHEIGHMENRQKALQYLIDVLGLTANTTGWEWLMGKATEYKERYANHTGMDILRRAHANSIYLKKVQKGYDDYIDRIRNYDTYWTSSTPPED